VRVTNIQGVLARVFVDDLDATIPFYEGLTRQTAHRFGFRDVQAARVGSFLLFAGDTEAYRDRVATVLVRDLGPVLEALTSSGGSVVEGPAPAPNGARLIARHPDGSVFEYIESGA
jgi:predicted enzyme related to lactoylglutathione lyase